MIKEKRKEDILTPIKIYLGIKGYNHCDYPLGKTVFCYLAIQIFICSGYEHCIANLSYYIYAGEFDGRDFGYLMLVTLGNLVGSVFFDRFLKTRDYFLKVSDEVIPVTAKKVEVN